MFGGSGVGVALVSCVRVCDSEMGFCVCLPHGSDVDGNNKRDGRVRRRATLLLPINVVGETGCRAPACVSVGVAMPERCRNLQC